MSRRTKIVITAIILMSAALAGWRLFNCQSCRSGAKNIKMEKVNLITKDKIKIVGAYYPREGEKGIILVHQLGLDKNSWENWPEKLNQAGWSVLAIDLRGHGESDLKYQSFSKTDFNNMIFDVKAARDYLQKQGKTKLYIMGSSIGANLAIMATGENLTDKGVALSPGLNYKGLKPETAAKKIIGPARILLISARDDNYSNESVKILSQIMTQSAEQIDFPSGGHGLNLLINQPILAGEIIKFLNK